MAKKKLYFFGINEFDFTNFLRKKSEQIRAIRLFKPEDDLKYTSKPKNITKFYKEANFNKHSPNRNGNN